jgi:hypothetical protein
VDNKLVLWKVTLGMMGTNGSVDRICEALAPSELAVQTIRVHPSKPIFWTGHEVQMLMEWELVRSPDRTKAEGVAWSLELLRCWPGAIHCQHFNCFDACEHGLVVGGAQQNGHKFFSWHVAENNENAGKASVVSCSVAPRAGITVRNPASIRKRRGGRKEESLAESREKEFDKKLAEVFSSMVPTVVNGRREIYPSRAPEHLLLAMRTAYFRDPITRRVLGRPLQRSQQEQQQTGGSSSYEVGHGFSKTPDLHVLWFLQQKMILDNHLISVRDHAYDFRKMRNSFLGEDAAHWLQRPHGLHLDPDDAILVGNLMWQYGLIDLVDPTTECHQWSKFTSVLSVAQKGMIEKSVSDESQSLESSIAFEKAFKGGLWYDDINLEKSERTLWPYEVSREECKPHLLGLTKLPFRSVGEGAYYTFVQLHLRTSFVVAGAKNAPVDARFVVPRFPRIFPEVPHMHGLSDSHIIKRLTMLLKTDCSAGASIGISTTLDGDSANVEGDRFSLVQSLARELKRVAKFASNREHFFSNTALMPGSDNNDTGVAGALESWLVQSDPELWMYGGQIARGLPAMPEPWDDVSHASHSRDTWRDILHELFSGISERCETPHDKSEVQVLKMEKKRVIFDERHKSDMKLLDLHRRNQDPFQRSACVLDLYIFASTVRLGEICREVVTHRGANDTYIRNEGRDACREAAQAIVVALNQGLDENENEAPGISQMLDDVEFAYNHILETDDGTPEDTTQRSKVSKRKRMAERAEKRRKRAFVIEFFITNCRIVTDEVDDDNIFAVLSPWDMWWTVATFTNESVRLYEKIRLHYTSLFGTLHPGTSFTDLVATTIDDCQANRIELESGVPFVVQMLQLFDPQIQNPPRAVWIVLLFYFIVALIVRFAWQMPIFCDCFGVPRMYPFCVTSPSGSVSRQCAKSWYGNGDLSLYARYKDQEFGAELEEGVIQNIDVSYAFWGLDKTPRNFYTSSDVGGDLSKATISHGRSMEFVFSTIVFSDIMLIIALIIHIAALQRKGVWQAPTRHSNLVDDVLESGYINQDEPRISYVCSQWMSYFRRGRWLWATFVKNVKLSVVPPRQRYGTDLYQLNQVFLLLSIIGLVLHKSRLWSGILLVIQENSVNFDSLAMILVYALFFILDRVSYILRNDILKMVIHHAMVILFVYQCVVAIPVVEQREQTTVAMNRHSLDTETWDTGHPLASVENVDVIWGLIFNPFLGVLDSIGLGFIFGSSVTIPVAAARIYEMYLFFALPMFIYLCFSGLQVCYGYPRLPNKTFLMRPQFRTMIASRFWLVWRAIPLRYELLSFIDWAFTDTTLFVSEWFMFQDIYSQLYVSACVYQAVMEISRVKGDRQPAWKKWIFGVIPAASILLALVLPLLLYSNAASTLGFGVNAQTYPEVKYVEIQLSIPGFSTMYNTKATPHYYSEEYYLSSAEARALSTGTFAYLNSGTTVTEDEKIAWKDRMASFTASQYSDVMWESSDVMVETLHARLKAHALSELQVQYTFTSSSVSGAATTAATQANALETRNLIETLTMTPAQTTKLADVVKKCSLGEYLAGHITIAGSLFPRTVYLGKHTSSVTGSDNDADGTVSVEMDERVGINSLVAATTSPAFDVCNLTCHGIPLFGAFTANVSGAKGEVHLPVSTKWPDSADTMRWDLNCAHDRAIYSSEQQFTQSGPRIYLTTQAVFLATQWVTALFGATGVVGLYTLLIVVLARSIRSACQNKEKTVPYSTWYQSGYLLMICENIIAARALQAVNPKKKKFLFISPNTISQVFDMCSCTNNELCDWLERGCRRTSHPDLHPHDSGKQTIAHSAVGDHNTGPGAASDSSATLVQRMDTSSATGTSKTNDTDDTEYSEWLAIEEKLFRHLVDVYRQPSELYRLTGRYEHWWDVKDDRDDARNDYR